MNCIKCYYTWEFNQCCEHCGQCSVFIWSKRRIFINKTDYSNYIFYISTSLLNKRHRKGDEKITKLRQHECISQQETKTTTKQLLHDQAAKSSQTNTKKHNKSKKKKKSFSVPGRSELLVRRQDHTKSL